MPLELCAIVVCCCLGFGFLFYRKFLFKYDCIDTIRDGTIRYVVVGGSSGVGRQVSKDLVSKYGAKLVIVIDVNEFDDHDAIYADSIRFVKCDISNVSQVQQALKNLSSALLGHPAVLVLSAAIAYPSLIDYSSSSSIINETRNLHTILSVNTVGIISFLYLFTLNVQSAFHVIVLSSCLGLSGVGNWSAYCTAKSGLISALESFRRDPEIIKLRIKTTLYCPFFIHDSPLFSKYHLMFFWSWLFKPISLARISTSIIHESLRISPSNHELWMPWFVYFAQILRLFPTFAYDFVFQVSGANNTISARKIYEN